MWRDVMVGVALVLAAFGWAWGPVMLQPGHGSSDLAPGASWQPAAAEESSPAVWRVEGAGQSLCDGDYRESGTYNGMPLYVGPAPRDDCFICFTGQNWVLSPVPGDPVCDLYRTSGTSLPGNPWSSAVGPSPAPTTTPARDFVVEGAGDGSCDGVYRQVGLHDGRPCYANGSRHLYWDAAHRRWALAASPGTSTPAYANGGDLPGRWIDDFGAGPAPAVAGGEAAVEAAGADCTGWIVEDAGDSSYDGEYHMVAVYNGRPCYVCENEEGPRYLFWSFAFPAPCWVLSDTICDDPTDGYLAMGGETTLPANPWGVNLAETPGPSLSAAPQQR